MNFRMNFIGGALVAPLLLLAGINFSSHDQVLESTPGRMSPKHLIIDQATNGFRSFSLKRCLQKTGDCLAISGNSAEQSSIGSLIVVESALVVLSDTQGITKATWNGVRAAIDLHLDQAVLERRSPRVLEETIIDLNRFSMSYHEVVL